MTPAQRQAQDAIERDDPVIYDVAAEHGQMVDNVRHMFWFRNAVALALAGKVQE